MNFTLFVVILKFSRGLNKLNTRSREKKKNVEGVAVDSVRG